MTYFTIPISAKSEEELAERIADNEKKGFELVKTYTREGGGNNWKNNGYRQGGQAVLSFAGSDSHRSYHAVMRRSNEEYLRLKSEAN